MANARPHIKAVARFEAPHNNDEGVLDVIEKVLNGKRRFIEFTFPLPGRGN
jgi:hydroxymethylpyrimidine pyrophosphatase-like HAD family hydrolase